MTLTVEQQELLHAFVDCEVSNAEAQIAEELISKSDEAREYADELKRLRALVAEHGCVAAPDGLRNRICTALRAECRQQAPIHQLPVVNWRTMVMAIAAAVVVSLGLIFAPSLMNESQGGSEIAESGTNENAATTMVVDDEILKFGSSQPGDVDAGDQRDNPQTPPSDPAEPAEGKFLPQNERQDAGRARAVLRLDRDNQPIEISVNMNRERSASTLQVYNDMLIVSCLYGDATLRDIDRDLDDRNESARDSIEHDFTGRDFSDFDGLEVEVNADEVTELLAALNRMTNDQGYGNIVLPGDLRRDTVVRYAVVDELQELTDLVEVGLESSSRENGSRNSENDPRAQGYLPADVQRDCLRRKAEVLPVTGATTKLSRALQKLEKDGPKDDAAQDNANGDSEAAKGARPDRRKVKLLLRLR
ncbi:MAG: hypothetical protein KDB32_03945 [Planctomycetes bacterium]|nr:hypothetical protein [Planctomycetota bacterium]